MFLDKVKCNDRPKSMKRNIETSLMLAVIFIIFAWRVLGANAQTGQSWQLGKFQRLKNAVPVILPNTNLVFDCPMNQRPIKWAALHTFDPAAIVRDGQVCVLHRAEDATGAMETGGNTSQSLAPRSQYDFGHSLTSTCYSPALAFS